MIRFSSLLSLYLYGVLLSGLLICLCHFLSVRPPDVWVSILYAWEMSFLWPVLVVFLVIAILSMCVRKR